MQKREIIICDECGSEFFKGTSQMESLCPACAHILYGYPVCHHIFKADRCIYCGWDGSKSAYIKGLEKPSSVD